MSAHTDQEPLEIWRTPQGVTLIRCSGRSAVKAQRYLPSHGRRLLALLGQPDAREAEQALLSTPPQGELLRAQSLEELSLRLQPEDTVLVIAPPELRLAQIARQLTGGMALTRLLVDTRAVANNVAHFRQVIGCRVQLMGMVKALGYGSGLVELPQVLAELGLDWLGVAAPDEGVSLRNAGVELPILVLLCAPEEARKIAAHRLTPALHSLDLVAPLAAAAQAQGQMLDVHLKVDTGMRRLGVMPEELAELAQRATETGWLKVTGLMTHLGCPETPEQDEITRAQLARFRAAIAELQQLGHRDFLSHAAATGAAARFPESHYDLVRIGLGLLGLYPSPAVAQACPERSRRGPNLRLDLAVALVTQLLEVRTYQRGDRIGYGATYEVPHDGFRAGIIPFGYHDGLPRCLSNRGFVLVNGQRAPLVGRVSMDSAVLDLSALPDARPGTEVLIYGKHGGHELRPEEVAAQADTISYELLTRLGPRVQRVFLA